MKILKIVLQTLLIAQFAFFGISKVIGTADMVQTFTTFGYPNWFMVLTGLIEVTAVLCLAYGFIKAQPVYYGAFLIAGLTIGAALSHAFIEGSINNAIIPLVVLTQTALMTWLHRRVTSSQEQLTLAAQPIA